MRSGALWVLLLSSLAVNGLAGGYLYLQANKPKQGNVLQREAAVSAPQEKKKNPGKVPSLISFLPEGKQETFINFRKETSAPLQEQYAKLSAARQAMLDVFQAENFSESAYAEKVAEAAAIQAEIYRIRSHPFIAIGKQLTLEERKQFVESFINRQQMFKEQRTQQGNNPRTQAQ